MTDPMTFTFCDGTFAFWAADRTPTASFGDDRGHIAAARSGDAVADAIYSRCLLVA